MRTLRFALPVVALALLAGCQPTTQQTLDYGMGERVTVGPLTYVVVESDWRTQLGELFNVRVPQNRFLVLTISVTNGGGTNLSVPLLELQGPKGQTYRELEDGSGLTGWLGLIRTLAPAQTAQGRVLFDVPLSSFKLRLPDGGESGYEKYAFVDIPLRIDADQVQSQMPTAIELK